MLGLKPLLDLRTSLRARLLLGMGLMLLLIVALAVVAFESSRAMVGAIGEVVEEQLGELQPVSSLLRLVLRAGMPPNDYLATGDPRERPSFERLAADADAAFSRLGAPDVFSDAEERRLIVQARREWEEARRLGWELLDVPAPVGDVSAARLMKAFDAQLERTTEVLEALHDRTLLEVYGYEGRSHVVLRRETALLVAVSLLSLLLAGGAAVLVSRSIVVPVRALQDGILRFAQGDHSFRVALEQPDEFGQLAQTMNRLAERVETDHLTGAASRSALQRRLRAELHRARSFERPVSLLMVDVDHFKDVNDHHGHPAGDLALRIVAERLAHGLRGVDTMARFGGEEFVLILPETTEAGGKAVAERLRASVAAEPVTVAEGVAIPITVSVGVAAFPSDGEDDAALLAAADRALYAAKRWGRDRVVEAAAVDPHGDPLIAAAGAAAREGATRHDPAA